MIILDHEQGTDEWLAARLGRPSASSFSKLITTSGEASTSAQGYIDQLAAERITGQSEPFYTNDHMQRGTELEPEARLMYEMYTGNEVEEVGFILHDSGEFGCSPDGLVGVDGGLEIKCPSATTMFKYIRDPDELVKQYYQQIQGCMYITERSYWDAFAYHPKLDHVLVRVERDQDFIDKLAHQINEAVTKIKNEVEKYNENRSEPKHQSE